MEKETKPPGRNQGNPYIHEEQELQINRYILLVILHVFAGVLHLSLVVFCLFFISVDLFVDVLHVILVCLCSNAVILCRLDLLFSGFSSF